MYRNTMSKRIRPDRTQNVFALVGFFLPCCPLQFIAALLYCSAAHAGKVFYVMGFCGSFIYLHILSKTECVKLFL